MHACMLDGSLASNSELAVNLKDKNRECLDAIGDVSRDCSYTPECRC